MKIPKELKNIVPKEVISEVKHLNKTGIPRCLHCHKNYKNGYDKIQKKISKYLWVPQCECIKRPITLSMG